MERGKLKVSPLRPLDDFLIGSARFQLPNYNDLEKWGNRVVQNLLYYQTNYFLMGIIMFLLISWLHPMIILLGVLSLIATYALFHLFVTFHSSAIRFDKEHPLFGIIITITVPCILLYLANGLILFLFAMLLPISSIFVHASLRLRNIKNKLSVNIERAMNHSTPMGVFLESLGLCVFIIFLTFTRSKIRKGKMSFYGTANFVSDPDEKTLKSKEF